MQYYSNLNIMMHIKKILYDMILCPAPKILFVTIFPVLMDCLLLREQMKSCLVISNSHFMYIFKKNK